MTAEKAAHHVESATRSIEGTFVYLDLARAMVEHDTERAFETLWMRGFTKRLETSRYPRPSAEARIGELHIGIFFWAIPHGDIHAWRLEESSFDLGASGRLDRVEKGEVVRYWLPVPLYARREYPRALTTLSVDLGRLADVVEVWTVDEVLRSGRRHVIRKAT